MRRGSKILIGFLTAALTYTSLMLFAGDKYGKYHGFRRDGGEREKRCERFNWKDADKATSIKPRKEESLQMDPKINNQ